MPAIPKTVKPVPNLPDFRWNVAANRYIAPNGRFVPIKLIRGELDRFITATTDLMGQVSGKLISGEVSLAQWQAEMMLQIKNANMAGAALESGGFYGMGPTEFGRAGSKIRGEYQFLNNFASEIEAGTQRLDGTLGSRARLYGEQGRVTYYDFAEASAKRDGFGEERSVLTPSESCDECISEDRASWRPIGKVVPIGDRQCLSNCNCYMQFRKKSGEIRTA